MAPPLVESNLAKRARGALSKPRNAMLSADAHRRGRRYFSKGFFGEAIARDVCAALPSTRRADNASPKTRHRSAGFFRTLADRATCDQLAIDRCPTRRRCRLSRWLLHAEADTPSSEGIPVSSSRTVRSLIENKLGSTRVAPTIGSAGGCRVPICFRSNHHGGHQRFWCQVFHHVRRRRMRPRRRMVDLVGIGHHLAAICALIIKIVRFPCRRVMA